VVQGANCGHRRIPDKHEDAELTQLITSSAGFLLQAPEGPNRASHAPQLRYLAEEVAGEGILQGSRFQVATSASLLQVCMYVDFTYRPYPTGH
jgi:hypothetical protein